MASDNLESRAPSGPPVEEPSFAISPAPTKANPPAPAEKLALLPEPLTGITVHTYDWRLRKGCAGI